MPTRHFATIACAVVLALTGCQKRPDYKDPTFQVSVRAKLTMNVAGSEQKVEADAAFIYAWKPEGKTRTLYVDSAEVRAALDGRDQMNVKMDRNGMIDRAGDKSVKAQDGPPQLKKMLTDCFGSPLCKIEVDADGKEVKRTVVAGDGAAPMIDSGMVANCTMFHPFFPTDRDEWVADMEVSAGNGMATGKVTYTKVPGGKGGQKVKVAGTLTADGVKGQGGLVIKNGKYLVAGDQTYDPERKQWVAGDLTMDVTFKATNGATDLTANGKMVVKFEMLSAGK